MRGRRCPAPEGHGPEESVATQHHDFINGHQIGNPRHWGGPSPEVFEACFGKKAGDGCLLHHSGWELAGVCNMMPEGPRADQDRNKSGKSDRIVCAPARTAESPPIADSANPPPGAPKGKKP